MTSQLAVPPDLVGEQRPRICTVPDYVSTSGREAVELASMAGLQLDEWQQIVLVDSLGERPDGQWASFEVGVVVSRQNGKGGILEARELAGLFLLGERLIIHSAHQYDTSMEAFHRLLALIEETPELDRRVKTVQRSHGEEGITLKTGQRIRFRTRTKGGGRGFTSDCLILDEAMELATSAHSALLPTLSARPNPQVWYLGSAVDQEVHANGYVFGRIRDRGLTGDPSLAFFEWSADIELDQIDEAATQNPEYWAQANPALGIRISEEYVSNESRSMYPRQFAVERLGVGDWPNPDVEAGRIITRAAWSKVAVEVATIDDPVRLAFDITPDRSMAAIAAAGMFGEQIAVDVIEHARGTNWIVDRIEELTSGHNVPTVYCDSYGPANSLIPELESRQITVVALTTKEIGAACGLFFDAVQDRTMNHLGQPELDQAVAGATSRKLGDQWAWNRRTSTVDICPLVAATIGHWAVKTQTGTGEVGIWSLDEVIREMKEREEGQ